MASPAEYIEELKMRISNAIRICVPQSEEPFRNSMDYVFAAYHEYLLETLENKIVPDRVLDFGPILLKMQERLIKEATVNTDFDTPKHVKYFTDILSAIHTDAFEDASISEEVKAVAASGMLKIVADNDTLFLENSANDRTKEVEKKYKKIVSEFTGKCLEIIPLRQYTEASTSQSEYREIRLLFDKELIEKLDSVLRGKWFSEESPKLTSVFNQENWIDNKPSVEWKKSRDSLLQLISLLNKYKSKIIGGVVADLVAKTFIVKGEIISKKLMINSYSKFLKKTHAKLPADVGEIEKIFNECKSKG